VKFKRPTKGDRRDHNVDIGTDQDPTIVGQLPDRLIDRDPFTERVVWLDRIVHHFQPDRNVFRPVVGASFKGFDVKSEFWITVGVVGRDHYSHVIHQDPDVEDVG